MNDMKFEQKIETLMSKWEEVEPPKVLLDRIVSNINSEEQLKSSSIKEPVKFFEVFKYQLGFSVATILMILALSYLIFPTSNEKVANNSNVAFQQVINNIKQTDSNKKPETKTENSSQFTLAQPLLIDRKNTHPQTIYFQEVKGKVNIIANGESVKVKNNSSYDSVDSLITESESSCRLNFGQGNIIYVKPKSKINVVSIRNDFRNKEDTNVFLYKGGIVLKPKKQLPGSSFIVETNSAVAKVYGTTFSVMVEEVNKTKVTVWEGKVNVKPKLNGDLDSKTSNIASIKDIISEEKEVISGESILISKPDSEEIKTLCETSDVKKLDNKLFSKNNSITRVEKKWFEKIDSISSEEAKKQEYMDTEVLPNPQSEKEKTQPKKEPNVTKKEKNIHKKEHTIPKPQNTVDYSMLDSEPVIKNKSLEVEELK